MIYEQGNIFAKILRGELPAHRVYEDDRVLVFMDIMPRSTGHALVIPKAPVRNLFDVAPEDLAYVAQTAQRVARAQMKAFDADGITLQQFNETAGGQVVFHLHIHLVPRFDGLEMRPPQSAMEKPEVLAENAAKLRAALEG